MSRNVYGKINDLRSSYIKLGGFYLNDIAIKTFELLLEIVNDKNDDEFSDFFIKYILGFEFKNKYYHHKYKYFNSIINVNELIDKIDYVNDEAFYKELNLFLTSMVNINNSIKREKQKAIKKVEIKTEIVVINNDKKKKKKSIPSTIKRLVWNINIGEEIGKSKCLCCNSTYITQMSFNCGHVIAEANGGDTIVSNLKPICQNCNSSMGTKNMDDFMKSLK